MNSNIEPALGQALERHRTGAFRDAERLYREALQVQPDHAEANHNLGMLLMQDARSQEALPHLKTAMQANPSEGRYWLSYAGGLLAAGNSREASLVLEEGRRSGLHGAEADALRERIAARHGAGPGDAERNALMTLFSARRFPEAETCARQMIQAWPDNGSGWKVLGAVLTTQQRSKEALPFLQRALELLPSDPQTHSNLGVALKFLGRLSEAEASYRRALELNPDHSEAHNNLGNTLQALGRFSDAEASYRRALHLKPDFHEAHANLGNILQSLGRLSEAEASARRALELKPDYAAAHSSLGSILQILGRFSEAEASCRRALELDPDFAEAHSNLGAALQTLGRLSEAETSYRRALELKPDLHEAHTNLGSVLHGLGRLSEAEAAHRRAIELKPDFHLAHSNLGITLQAVGRISEAAESYRRVLEFRPDYHEAHSNLIFSLDLLEGGSVREQQAERARWYARHGRRFAESIAPHENLPDPERKLRIGYVSADFRKHAANYAFGPIVRLHEHSAFEVICYSGVTLEDEATVRLRQAVEGWRSTLGVSDEALAAQIRNDRIDILVDLSSHMAGNRLPVFARKPAPVQVTAWGYPNGTGMETIDYLFGDAVVIPGEERKLFAEEVIDLPCFLCYEPPEHLPEVSPLPALAGKPFTFGCVSRIEKISDGVLRLWGRILAALPQAELLIKGQALDDPAHRQRFVGRLRDAGIGVERVRLLGGSTHAELLKTFHQVDLGLDPFPHGGAIGTAEALWMGVPVVTLQGATFMSRISASILTALQMQEWIARSEDEYLRIAVEAAGDLGRLTRTREELRPRLAASIFGDVQRYTREVEAAYRSTWRRWCASKKSSAPPIQDARELNDLGVSLKELGRPEEAAQCYRRALELMPDSPEIFNNLGTALGELGHIDEAVRLYRRALELKPEFPEAHNNLGNALSESGRLEDAVRCYRRALELKPGYYRAHNNLGNALKQLGRLDEAVRCFRRALELKPEFFQAHSNLLLTMNYQHAQPALVLKDEARRYGRLVAQHATPITDWPNPVDASRALNVGLVSGDLNAHPVGFFLEAVVSALDAGRIRLFAYQTTSLSDRITERLKGHFEQWRLVAGLGDRKMAELIRNDGIDILIDLAGHTAGNRLPVFAWKPAPVQVAWLGYFATTGVPGMDYLLADPWSVPRGDEDQFTEQIWRLPETRFCFTPPEGAAEVGPLPALVSGRPAFGCFNNPAKLNDGILDAWARVLEAVPDSRLFLKGKQLSDAAFQEGLSTSFAQRGIEPSRLIFEGFSSRADYFAAYHRVDIALDTFPYSGATTAMDALWMGVPVVTLKGDRLVSHQVESLLMNAGMQDWIGADVNDYAARAIRHIADLGVLAEIRQGLREQVQDSPLMDAPRFAAHFEAALRVMWQKWCDRLEPDLHRTAPGAQDTGELMDLFSAQRYDEAEAAARRMVRTHPDYAFGWKALGTVLAALQRPAEALPALQRNLSLSPSDPESHSRLGNVLHQLGRLPEAETSYRRALELGAERCDVHNDLGNVLLELGRADEAASCYRRAIALDAGYHRAHNNLGNALLGMGGAAEAEASYRRAIEIAPDYASAYNNLGAVLHARGCLSEAESCYRRALELRPDYPEAYNNLAMPLRDMGRLPEAEACYRRALELKPDYHEARSNLIFLMAYCSLGTPEDYLAEARQWEIAAVSQEARRAATRKSFARSPRSGRALRIGYVSGDLKNHVVSQNIEGVLQAHDRRRVEVFAYPTFPARDAVTARIRRNVAHWSPLVGLPDEAALELIAGDRIDVLVDLSGHTAHNRLGIFARRAAPVQCHYLGYFASTGISEMDYWIGDPVLIPLEHGKQFTETVWRLPRIWVSYVAPEESPDTVWRPGSGRTVCLGSFNQLAKITPRTVSLWARVLRRIPDAYLLLKTKQLEDAANRSSMLAAFARHGIPASRIELMGQTPDTAAHLSLYCRLDVALDPVGAIAGGITTSEALWMGTPVVSLAGLRTAERLTTAILAGIGREEWTASDEDDYVEKVARLAADPALRQRLRLSLRETMRNSSFYDSVDMARALEDAYEAMFDRWTICSGGGRGPREDRVS